MVHVTKLGEKSKKIMYTLWLQFFEDEEDKKLYHGVKKKQTKDCLWWWESSEKSYKGTTSVEENFVYFN